MVIEHSAMSYRWFVQAIVKEPVGVVLVVAPWNYPLMTSVNHIIPAILAGNAVAIKHASRTPLCADHFVEAFEAAGVPEGLVVSVPGEHSTISTLMARPEVNYVAFTGSVEGGRRIYQTAASNLIEARVACCLLLLHIFADSISGGNDRLALSWVERTLPTSQRMQMPNRQPRRLLMVPSTTQVSLAALLSVSMFMSPSTKTSSKRPEKKLRLSQRRWETPWMRPRAWDLLPTMIARSCKRRFVSTLHAALCSSHTLRQVDQALNMGARMIYGPEDSKRLTVPQTLISP